MDTNVKADYYFKLIGPVPSKKSEYIRVTRRGGKSGLALPRDVVAQMDSLQLQLQAKWRGRAPLVHPEVEVKFTCTNPASDRDGMKATLLDIMQNAGVLINDNIRFFNGNDTNLPADICEPGREMVEIWLTEQGNRSSGSSPSN